MTSGTDKGMVFAMVGFPVTYALTDFNCYILIFVKVSVVIIANECRIGSNDTIYSYFNKTIG